MSVHVYSTCRCFSSFDAIKIPTCLLEFHSGPLISGDHICGFSLKKLTVLSVIQTPPLVTGWPEDQPLTALLPFVNGKLRIHFHACLEAARNSKCIN